MNKYKVCVYAISKNEEKFVDRWMASVSEADIVIVRDTGSDDATVEKLQKCGAHVYSEKIEPWRFDTARNCAMSHIPEDADICVSCDLDEVFESGWRKKLEDAWDKTHTRARYLFTWSFNPDGTPNKQFVMEKIHCRHGYKWVHPCHEVLEYNNPNAEKKVWVNGLVLHHYPDLTKPRGQYLPLLELSARENPEDSSIIFWLGREYMYNKKHDLCIKTLKKHLALPSASWDEERSASMRFIGESYESAGNLQEAKSWYFRALAECPTVREPYLKLAMTGYFEGDWPLVYSMVKKGLRIVRKSGSYLTEPESWGYLLYELGAIGAYRLGLYKESYDYAKKALQLNNNERQRKNLQIIESAVKGQQEG